MLCRSSTSTDTPGCLFQGTGKCTSPGSRLLFLESLLLIIPVIVQTEVCR